MEKIQQLFPEGGLIVTAVTEEIIQAIADADLQSTCNQTDFPHIATIAGKIQAAVTFQANRHRKPAHTAKGASCSVAQELRIPPADSELIGEMRTAVRAHKKQPTAPLVVIHTPADGEINNTQLKKIINGHITGSGSYSSAKVEALATHGLDHLGGGLFNPFTPRQKPGNTVHVIHSAIAEEVQRVFSTNAGSRAVGMFATGQDFTKAIQTAYPRDIVLIGDIIQHNLTEI